MGALNTAIRQASVKDAEAIRQVHLSAFDDDENRQVAELAVRLLSEADSPQSISWVAESEGKLVGHVGFSQVTLAGGGQLLGVILAPLGVRSGYQASGIGSALLRHGLEWLTDSGTQMVFVYGDPKYYGRFGFSADAALGFLAPCPLQYPHGWQAIVLDGADGVPQAGQLACVAALSDPGLW